MAADQTRNAGPSLKPLLHICCAIYLGALLKLVVFKHPEMNPNYFGMAWDPKVGYWEQLLSPEYFRVRFAAANFTPFKSTLSFLTSDFESPSNIARNLLGNVLIFVPAGLLLPFYSTSRNMMLRVVLAVALISGSIELIQLLFAIGRFDIDDVILNSLGGVFGWLLYSLLESRLAEQVQGTNDTTPL